MHDETTGGRRVILADDTEDMRVLLRMVLLGADYTVVQEAADGTAALRAWKESRPPDVYAVILDQRMPGLEGIEVAAQILAEEPRQRVVLFSAQMSDDIRQRAAALGVTACLSKDQVLNLPQIALEEP